MSSDRRGTSSSTITFLDDSDLDAIKGASTTAQRRNPTRRSTRIAPLAQPDRPAQQTRVKSDHDRIADLERVVGKLASDLTNARAVIGRLHAQIDVLEVGLVREMEGGDGWRSSAMTAYEREFQRLKSRVKDKAKAKSEKEGWADYDQDAYQAELWGDPGSFT